MAVNTLYEELESRVRHRFARGAFDAGHVELERAVDIRFSMQVHELDVEVPRRTIHAGDVEAIVGAFVEKYEQMYGKNSAYTEAGVEMVTFRSTGTVRLPRPSLEAAKVEHAAATAQISTRKVYFASARDFVPAAVYAGERVGPGASLDGPAIIQRMGVTAARDAGRCSRPTSIFGARTLPRRRCTCWGR